MTKIRRIGLFFLALLIVTPLAGIPARGAELKPIVLDPTCNHDRFGTMPRDIVKEFRACIRSLAIADDNDDNGTPDKWAIPEWVAYEIKALPPGTTLGKGPKRPDWMTDAEPSAQGIAAPMLPITSRKRGGKRISTVINPATTVGICV